MGENWALETLGGAKPKDIYVEPFIAAKGDVCEYILSTIYFLVGTEQVVGMGVDMQKRHSMKRQMNFTVIINIYNNSNYADLFIY